MSVTVVPLANRKAIRAAAGRGPGGGLMRGLAYFAALVVVLVYAFMAWSLTRGTTGWPALDVAAAVTLWAGLVCATAVLGVGLARAGKGERGGR
jgi:hypothetical protein